MTPPERTSRPSVRRAGSSGKHVATQPIRHGAGGNRSPRRSPNLLGSSPSRFHKHPQRLSGNGWRRRKLVDADQSRWVNDPILNECLQKIRKTERKAWLAMWVLAFAYRGRLARQVAERLCWRGILRAEEQKRLLFFSRQIYPEINPDPERAVIERLREAIFTDADDISPRTVVLATLADACKLLHPIFGRKELGSREVRLKQLANGQLVGQHVGAAVNTAQTVLGAAGSAVAVAVSPGVGALMDVF